MRDMSEFESQRDRYHYSLGIADAIRLLRPVQSELDALAFAAISYQAAGESVDVRAAD